MTYKQITLKELREDRCNAIREANDAYKAAQRAWESVTTQGDWLRAQRFTFNQDVAFAASRELKRLMMAACEGKDIYND
jgi:hypothetical protein